MNHDRLQAATVQLQEANEIIRKTELLNPANPATTVFAHLAASISEIIAGLFDKEPERESGEAPQSGKHSRGR